MPRLIKLNRRGMAAMLKSAGVRATLERPAEKALAKMRAGAPVASGEYKASLHIWDDTTDRAVKRVGSDVAYAMVVEANTGNMARSL